MMKKNYYLICVLLLAAFCTTGIATAQNYFGDFPVKADPKTVGNKLSRRLMETKHQLYFDRGNTGENKRNQGKEGDGLKTGQKLPPFPFIIFIKERW